MSIRYQDSHNMSRVGLQIKNFRNLNNYPRSNRNLLFISIAKKLV